MTSVITDSNQKRNAHKVWQKERRRKGGEGGHLCRRGFLTIRKGQVARNHHKSAYLGALLATWKKVRRGGKSNEEEGVTWRVKNRKKWEKKENEKVSWGHIVDHLALVWSLWHFGSFRHLGGLVKSISPSWLCGPNQLYWWCVKILGADLKASIPKSGFCGTLKGPSRARG